MLSVFLFVGFQECESKIAQEIASLSKEDVSKEEMTENEEEVINLLLAQVSDICKLDEVIKTESCVGFHKSAPHFILFFLDIQENEILTEQEELISLEQVLRRQIATEKEEIERLRAEIADIQR